MTFTAREIVQKLHDSGYLDAWFSNTGGGVYNVTFSPICQHGMVLGEVRASDGGDWTESDIDEPADTVTVYAVNPDGEGLWFEFHRGPQDVVSTFEEFSVRLEDNCPQCVAGTVEPAGLVSAREVLARFDAADAEFVKYSNDPDIREKYVDGARWDCESMAWELAEALRAVLDGGEQ